jgi:serine acetyltransferase
MAKRPVALIGYKSGFDTITEIIEAKGLELLGLYDQYFYGNTDEVQGIPVIGSEEKIPESDIKNVDFILSTGWAGHHRKDNIEHNGDNLRRKRIKLIRQLGLNCPPMINPEAYVHRSTLPLIGEGVIIGRHCQIRANVTIGAFSYIDNLSSIGHDVTIGENLSMPPYSFVGGYIDFGSNVLIGAGSTIVNGYSDRNLKIGNEVKIVAGSTVTKSIPDGKTYIEYKKKRMLGRIDNIDE